MMSEREINLYTENVRLRKGLVIAEAFLRKVSEKTPSTKCDETIAVIRNSLEGGVPDQVMVDAITNVLMNSIHRTENHPGKWWRMSEEIVGMLKEGEIV
jgi:hypothetical protein